MALSGTFYGTTSNQYIQPKIVWSATQSISGNSSTVTATLYYSRTNKGYTTEGNGSFSITINGVKTTASKRITLTYNSNTQAMTATVNVPHNADGSKSVAISATGSLSGTTLSSTSISSTVTLDTIPRATQPSLSASSVNMGSAVTISLPRASSSFTHDLAYSFRGGSYVAIASGVGTSYSWTVPDLVSSIPSAISGSMTIRCVTKNGSTTIGTKTVSLTAKVPGSVVPTISSVAISEATSGLAAQFGAYIQSKSKLSVTITAAGAKGSTISSYRTTFRGKTYTARTWTSDILTASGTLSMTTTVTDSRGRTASKTTTVSVLAYTPPRIQAFSVYRCNSEGAADDEGLYIAVRYKYSAPNLNDGNTASWAVQYKQSTATSYSPLLSGSGLSGDATEKPSNPTFSTDYQYDVRLAVTDYFGATATADVELPSGKVILDIAANGLGLAIGKTSERGGFEVEWPVYVNGKTLSEIHAHQYSKLNNPNYWGVCMPNGTEEGWLRAPDPGIIPNVADSAGMGYLGTSDFPWLHLYVKNINGNPFEYELGTWTPILGSTAGTAAAPTATYTYNYGKYTRIGRLVYINFRIECNITAAGSGYAQIDGLPYTFGGSGYHYIGLSENVSKSTSTLVNAWVFRGTYIRIQAETGTSAAKWQVANNIYLSGSGIYEIAV